MIANENPRNSLLESDRAMVEMSLLVPSWQIDALERIAADEGLTIGQLLRRLVNKTIAQHATSIDEPLFPDSH
jgi:hypothetical protein